MNQLCEVDGCDLPAHESTVCDSCINRLRVALGDVPALAAELDHTLARLSVMGEKSGPRSAGNPLPYDPRASEAIWVLRNTLTTWVRLLQDIPEDMRGQWPAATLAGMARWLLARAGRIRVHPAGGDAVDEITGAAAEAKRVIDRQADRVYAGPCHSCGTDMTARPGAPWARCRTCGDEYEVGECNAWMRGQLEDRLCTATEMAGLLMRTGVTVTDAMIRGYAHRRRITVKTWDENERPMYRVGDVLDIIIPAHVAAC